METEEGIWVVYELAKQAGEVKENHFLVPFTIQHPLRCFASRVLTHLRAMERKLGAIKPYKPLFFRVTKHGYAKQAMGLSLIHI